MADQTYELLTKSGNWTLKHPEAHLFGTLEEAEAAKVMHQGHFIDPIEDEAEFRAREDTW